MTLQGPSHLGEAMKRALPHPNAACYIALFSSLSAALMIVGLALACFCE